MDYWRKKRCEIRSRL